VPSLRYRRIIGPRIGLHARGVGIGAGTVGAPSVNLPQSGFTSLALDLSAVPSGNTVTVAVPSGSLISLQYLY
jgi:hypothetical protein